MKQRYHFLTIRKVPSGKQLVTLPGQRLGRKNVLPGILVKDRKGSTLLERTRRHGQPGDVFFTTTLRNRCGFYTAEDIHPLRGYEDVTLSGVEDAWKEYAHRCAAPDRRSPNCKMWLDFLNRYGTLAADTI